MATKLLLIDDVEDLGRSGDVVNVRPGYARNFLLPRGVAVPADANTLRRQARLKEVRLQKAIEDKKEAEAVAEKLVGVTLTHIVKVDHEGHMYGSVSANDIAHLLSEQLAMPFEKRAVLLKHAIKEVGVYEVAIKLKEGVVSQISVKIVPEEGSATLHEETR